MSDESGKGDDSGKLLYCSFCGKSQHEVRKLIAGPTVYICNECVEVCLDIIAEESIGWAGLANIKSGAAVAEVIEGTMHGVQPTLQTRYREIDLPLTDLPRVQDLIPLAESGKKIALPHLNCIAF